jgi:hypothetical protein
MKDRVREGRERGHSVFPLDFGCGEEETNAVDEKHLPFRAYGKGPVIELIREMGAFVNKKTPLEVTDAFRSDESGEIVCEVTFEGNGKVSAALTNLKLDINHPLYRKVKNYRDEVVEDLGRQELDVNRSSFKVGDLYRKNK